MKRLSILKPLIAVAALLASGSVLAASVTPVTYTGNFTDCSQLGVPGLLGASSGGAPTDPQTYDLGAGHSITFDYNPDGQSQYLDFDATVPMDYVVVKGGSTYNVFHYDPAQADDTQLYAPDNSSGEPAGVSHVAWCFLPRPTGGKTADAEWDRHTDWTLDKTVTPASIHMFDGDTHQVQYTVTATPASEGVYRVSGTIAVSDPFDAGWEVIEVADVMQFNNNGMQFMLSWDGAGGAVDTLSCSVPASNPEQVILDCDYGFELASADHPFLASASGGVNAAGIKAARDAMTLTITTQANFTIPGAPANSYGDDLTVDDSMLAGTDNHVFDLDGPHVWTYGRTQPFACDADEGQHKNTATGTWNTGTGTDSTDDSATVDVACDPVGISKTAVTRYNRDYGWTPDKRVVVNLEDADLDGTDCLAEPISGGSFDGYYLCENASVRLNDGGSYQTVYRLAASRTIEEEDGFAVSGTIDVTWPSALSPDFEPASPSDTLTFTDATNGTQSVTPACGTQAAGALACTYDATLPRDFVSGYDEAAITRVKKCYDAQGVATDCGTKTYTSSQVALTYGEPNQVTDDCVMAEDLFNGVVGNNGGGSFALQLGERCDTFSEYVTGIVDGNSFDILADWILPAQVESGSCEFQVPNVLTIGKDNNANHSATANVIVSVPELCETGGCTYTQGYWKTHSSHGPAPYDAAWALIGEDTLFFASGQTWHQVFWTPPRKGNAYYILAHQYMAARLNVEAAAGVPPVVQSALAQATAWFDGRGTNAPKGNDREIAIDLAGTLAAYNEGDIGPGHCSVSPATDLQAK